MTREEAINVLHGMKADKLNLDDFYTKDQHEALEMAIKALEQQPCEDCISRQAALDAVRKNTFRLSLAEEQGCEGHVAWWSEDAVYSDVIEGALLELPPVAPQPKTGHWIDNHNGTISCSYCHTWFHKDDRYSYMRHCPDCGAKMQEVEE